MEGKRAFSRFLSIVVLSLILCLFMGAQKAKKDTQSTLTHSLLQGMEWRCLGPANMGGRIDDFAVNEKNPSIFYVGTASGGIWKTVNNGITWEPIFDDQETSTIGDLAVSPSHPDIVWAGTGEANNRQSSSWGNGVYKSTDAGKTWQHMGLEDTHHIGRVVIHPRNPDIVYVAAAGHLWGPNRERGLFKTLDGGKSWEKAKYINEDTGFIDVAIDPENPETLYAAAYQRRRRGWGFIGGGPHSGLYKTTDGGESWIRLNNGLPEGDMGRIGIDIYRRDPNIVYAIVESKKGGVYRSEDKGFTWKRMSSTNPRPMYYSQIRIDPGNDQRIWVLGAPMYFSEDGGKTFKTDRVTRVHGDHHAMWINPVDSGHMILGSDGGIYVSYDKGKSWDFINNIPLGQFYEIGLGPGDPYWIYGGLQDNGSWGGPSKTWYARGITNEEWIKIGGGDGFYTQVDPRNPDLIYIESQTGYLMRFDRKTGESKSIRPEPKDPKEEYRFNWNCPILISPHDSDTIYYGGNKLFISRDMGDNWEETIDLTRGEDRDKMALMGMIPDKDTLSKHDGIAYYGDITTIAESPLVKGLLYVGTDDGYLQVSRDGGKTWTNVAGKIPGLPEKTYVSRVIASYFAEGTAYAVFDGHRNNDFAPYVYITRDYGRKWESIAANIPHGSTVNVIREHHRNPKLLFVGTERGAFFTIDQGKAWIKFKGDFPVVPVDDIALHPGNNDLVFGTHGRSIWILDDITPLEKISGEILNSPAHLFDVGPAVQFNPFSHKGNTGQKVYIAPNPPYGAVISYYLKEEAKNVRIHVENSEGKMIRILKGSSHAGINRISWDLRYGLPEGVSPEEARGYLRVRGPNVLPGKYTVSLQIDENNQKKEFEINGDPRIDISFEDRKSQHDSLMRIYNVFPAMKGCSQTLNEIRKQVSGIKRILKKFPEANEALSDLLKSISEKTDGIQKRLYGDRSLGYRSILQSIRGGLMMLQRSIGSFTGAPSEAQMVQIGQKISALKDTVDEINRIIEEDFPRINRILREKNVPHIPPIKIIKFEVK